MGFIANANGSIYAESWTPEVQKLFAGQETPQGVLQPVQAAYISGRQLGVYVTQHRTHGEPPARRSRRRTEHRRRGHLLGGPATRVFTGGCSCCPRSARTASSSCGRSSRASATRSTLGRGRRGEMGRSRNYRTVFSDPTFLSVLGHAFELMIYFSAIPVVFGLVSRQ